MNSEIIKKNRMPGLSTTEHIITHRVLKDLYDERLSQMKRHSAKSDDDKGMGALTHIMISLANEAHGNRRGNNPLLRKRLIQTAATAIAAVQVLDRMEAEDAALGDAN